MFMNNKFSTKNKLLYKMKCLNTRNEEYKELERDFDFRVEKFNDKKKKWKIVFTFFIFFVIIISK